VVDRTRGIVLEWVDRGGGVKKKGNGRGLTGVRTGGLGWESGGNSWSGWGDGEGTRGDKDWGGGTWSHVGQARSGVHYGGEDGTGRVGRARKRSL
jgi:hypothetical protein